MSKPPTPTPTGRPAKSMSSRLMTMKFMQRAASSAAAASSLPTRPSSTSSQNAPPPDPSSSSPSSLHPSKRPKSSSFFGPNSSTTSSFFDMTPQSELQFMREALAAEEAKRSQALERQAADAGHETKWVLSTGPNDVKMGGFVVGAGITGKIGRGDEGMGLWVRPIGYSEIDNAGSEEDEDGDVEGYYIVDDYGAPGNSNSVASNMMGRRSFGKFNRELEKRSKTADQQSSSSSDEATGATTENSDEEAEEDVDTDGSNDPLGTNDLIRSSKREAAHQQAKAERNAQKNSRKAEAAQLAERRRSKEIKLNSLSSISGGGGIGGSGGGSSHKGRRAGAPNSNVECYNCGEIGHVRLNCPNKKSDLECYNCGEIGHARANCPNLKNSGGGGGRDGKLKRKSSDLRGGGAGGSGSMKRSKISSSFFP